MATDLRRHVRPAAVVAAGLSGLLASVTASAAPLTTLFAFDGADGFGSQAPPIADANGNLFGTTAQGGSADRGVVFELSPPKTSGGAWTYAVLHEFGGTGDGTDSLGGLVMNSRGVLFGTTYMGGAYDQGTAFMLTPPKTAGGAWRETVLYSFGANVDSGYLPAAGLLPGPHGVLYGTASYSGAEQGGAVFALVPPVPPSKVWTETILYEFPKPGTGDGYSPQAGMIADAQGNLYGTTINGGANGLGAAFELSPVAGGGYSESVLYSFGSTPTDGSWPQGPLLLGPGGVLFGTTLFGGVSGAGTVFELTRGSSGWSETVVHSFANDNVDGVGPQGPLTMDTEGNLYGATPYGGTKTFGVIFRLSPTKTGPWGEKILHDFTSAADGSTPYGGLSMSASGTLYGTTSAGGSPADGRWGYGTVYQFAP